MNKSTAAKRVGTKPPRYSEEFRREAVAKVTSGQFSLRELSKDLGVSAVSLIKWRRDAEKQSEEAPPQATPQASYPSGDPNAEIMWLRGELEKVSKERDRLKKSIMLLIGAED